MPTDASSGRPAGPVVLRIKLRYSDVESMVQRFAPNVGKSGLFLPTRSLQPVGAEIKFELRLASGKPVLLGLGKVKSTKEPDPQQPKATFGMAIALMRVTRESRDLILKMLERRRALGLPDVSIPMPSDIDAARRGDFLDTGVRAAAPPTSGDSGVAAPRAKSETASESLLTAPRRPSAPLAVVKKKVSKVKPLAPEPSRRVRPAVAEVLEAAASAPVVVAPLPELDDADVDVNAVLARARVLAGGDVDAELEALRETAAPLEIDVEAASAELARQLGGVAVRRDARGHGWAPPPVVAEAATPASAEATADAAAAEPTAEPVPADAAPIAPAPDDDAQEVEPDQIRDEIHELDESDYEEVEHTQIGSLLAHIAPSPEQVALADKLDAHLAAVEAEAEADDLGIGEASYQRGTLPPAQIFDDEPADELDELDETPLPDEATPPPALPPEYQQDFIHHFDAPTAPPMSEPVVGVEASETPGFPVEPAYAQPGFSSPVAPEAAVTEPSYAGPEAEPYAEPAPAYVEVEPYAEPAPGYAEPAPGYTEPAPAYAEPAPAYAEPAYAEPAPGYAEPAPGYAEPAPAYAEPAPAYAEPAYAEPAPGYAEPAPAYAEPASGYAEAYPAGAYEEPIEHISDDDIEEIDELEILAEADAADADLLEVHGEAEISGAVAMPAELHARPPSVSQDYVIPPPVLDATPSPDAFPIDRPSESDFALRLDLGDDDVEASAAPVHADLDASAGNALAGFFDDIEEPSRTLAERPSPLQPGNPRSASFDHSDVARDGAPVPSRFDEPPPKDQWSETSGVNRWRGDTPIPGPPPNDEIDLESALEALDVDLDDLGTPHADTELAHGASSSVQRRITIRPPSSSQRAESEAAPRSGRGPRPRAPRVNTEDGVMIDFDDDDD